MSTTSRSDAKAEIEHLQSYVEVMMKDPLYSSLDIATRVALSSIVTVAALKVAEVAALKDQLDGRPNAKILKLVAL